MAGLIEDSWVIMSASVCWSPLVWLMYMKKICPQTDVQLERGNLVDWSRG